MFQTRRPPQADGRRSPSRTAALRRRIPGRSSGLFLAFCPHDEMYNNLYNKIFVLHLRLISEDREEGQIEINNVTVFSYIKYFSSNKHLVERVTAKCQAYCMSRK